MKNFVRQKGLPLYEVFVTFQSAFQICPFCHPFYTKQTCIIFCVTFINRDKRNWNFTWIYISISAQLLTPKQIEIVITFKVKLIYAYLILFYFTTRICYFILLTCYTHSPISHHYASSRIWWIVNTLLALWEDFCLCCLKKN